MVNNKKRKEIEIQENDNNDNNDDDDNDDNGLLTYKKFKEDINYNSIRCKQLQTIANSLGLPIIGKKQEIYKRIEGYFLSKKVKNDLTNSTTNQPQQQQPQQQPQQKQYVLLIKDVDQLEIYFWKAFRNMIIFKNIFSNFKSKQFSYHDLIGIDENFLKSYSNSLEIIKDNIKGNINHQIIRNTNDILNIIKTLKKKDNETISFYNTLFSTFSSSTTTTTTTTITQPTKSLISQFDENIDLWVQRMILNENLVALDQFIKFFKINSDILKKSIEMHVNPSFFDVVSYNNLKIYNYLKSINAIPTSHIKQRFSNINLSDSLSFGYKFKRLIKSYKLLVDQTKFKEIQEIHQQEQEEQEEQKMNLNKDNIEKLNQLILELNEIELSYFTNNQLNSTILNLLNQTTTTTTTTTTNPILITNNNNIDLKDIIKKYYKSIYLFFKIIKEGNLYNRNLKIPIHYYLYFKKEKSVGQLYEIFCVKNYNYNYLIFFKSILMDQNLERNQRLELVSKILDIENGISFQNIGYIYNFNFRSFNSFCRVLFSINDTELIDHLIKTIKKLKLVQDSKTKFPSVSEIISTNFQYINKNEIVDFFFENYRNETTLFDDQNQNWYNNHINIIYHIEKLMVSIGKRLRLSIVNYYDWFTNGNKSNEKKYKINILLDQLKRAISKPLLYSFFNESGYYINKLSIIFGCYLNNGNEFLINHFLSNQQFKQPFKFSEIINGVPLSPQNKMPNTVKLIFNNISKESIESKLYQVKFKFNFSYVHGYYHDDFIPLTSTISTTTTTTTTTTNSEEVGQFIIGETGSFDFTISPRILFICLYYLDRVDDIFYLFDKIPEIFNSTYFSNFTQESYLYNICSSYYLRLFINYFIENLNDNTINHLYTCLCVASSKGFIQIFKDILSSNQNSQSLLKVRTRTNQSSLFQSNLLCDMVVKSINSSNFQLSNLLIDFIDFSPKNEKVLRSKIFKSSNNK
ncbi:hypothetical protein ACTFIR_000168 [Dictyostelium discoideum]